MTTKKKTVGKVCTFEDGNQIGLEYSGTVRPREIKAMQFEGKNSRVVAKWIRDHSGVATARGTYVAVHKYINANVNMTKGDWAVWDVETDEITVYDNKQFHEMFQLRG